MTLRGRPRKWRIDDADDSLTSKIDSDVAVEVLREASLDQSGSKPTSSRGLNRRSVGFLPSQTEPTRRGRLLDCPGDAGTDASERLHDGRGTACAGRAPDRAWARA